MKYDQFIKHVQTQAQLNSREEAQRVTSAVLEAIKERIVGDEAKDLAAQLPKELGEFLRGREGENGQHFGLEEFIKLVSEKESVEANIAKTHIKAVFAVLQNAVSPGEYKDFHANFSPDYEELFSPASTS